jgi:molybdopterin synthase catalytic subunit
VNVDIMLFAGLRQRAGRSQIQVEVPEGATIATLLDEVSRAHPELASSLSHCRVALNQEFATADQVLEGDGDRTPEVALIPPVSGGHDGEAPRSTDAHAQGERSLLTGSALSLSAVVDAVSHRDAGGISTFTGNVREQSRGKTVRFLEYEAYAPMAVREMDRIAIAVESEIPGTRVALQHRVGRLEIGEAAVVIAASAPHRAEAFEACRAVIERLKQSVPIWKREVDAAGGEWIGQGP